MRMASLKLAILHPIAGWECHQQQPGWQSVPCVAFHDHTQRKDFLPSQKQIIVFLLYVHMKKIECIKQRKAFLPQTPAQTQCGAN